MFAKLFEEHSHMAHGCDGLSGGGGIRLGGGVGGVEGVFFSCCLSISVRQRAMME